MKDQFHDAQLYIDLCGATGKPLDPAAALGSFLRAIGVDDRVMPSDLWDRGSRYRSLLTESYPRSLVLLPMVTTVLYSVVPL